ncbi:MAG: hypothetical protein OXI87_22075 [Albidovulum sp.]|nr:hypothetical protein [Albidovulum sp.]MDE0307542.1 hypothetical protein [Albidovulum sp.]MDE0530194.1 hypothetical protein [Albidovulum sp.]
MTIFGRKLTRRKIAGILDASSEAQPSLSIRAQSEIAQDGALPEVTAVALPHLIRCPFALSPIWI